MKFEWQGRNSIGQFSFEAYPEEYDAIPKISEFVFDSQPLLHNNDIWAVACSLVFSRFCSGNITFPKPISPETALAISRYVDPIWVAPGPIDYVPRAIPQGGNSVFVTDSISEWNTIENRFGCARCLTICTVPGSEYFGALFSPDGALISSNSELISASLGGSPEPYIALALLFCETYRASTIYVSDSLNVEEELFIKLRPLLAACKISLMRGVPNFLRE